MNTSLIFPLLLSFFPGWILILKNYDELILDDLLITLSIIGITFVFWIIVKKIIRSDHKSSLIIGTGVAFFFYFGFVCYVHKLPIIILYIFRNDIIIYKDKIIKIFSF